MSARDSLPGARRPLNYAAIGLALVLLPMGAGIIAQWTVMDEARGIAAARDVEQNARIATIEARVRDIENNRSIERQLADMQVSISGRLAAVETELKALQERRR